MEKLMYESRPYAFMMLGIVAFMSNSPYRFFAWFCAALLVFCSGAILYWRHSERQQSYARRRR